jgi:Skp family chaperone for outer membrane proteins
MKRLIVLIPALLLTLASTRTLPEENRVGTFNRQAIVVAYYRSPQWADTLKQKRAALEEAKRANDAAKIKELNAWGGESQELAHRQLADGAPITNILEALKPTLDEIEKSEHLANIVPAPAPDTKTPTVDVTPQLLDRLKADENTRKIIQDLPRM